MNLEEKFIFQQDNDSKHTVKKKIKEIFLGFKHQIVEMTCTKFEFKSYRNLWSLLDSKMPLEERTKTIASKIYRKHLKILIKIILKI